MKKTVLYISPHASYGPHSALFQCRFRELSKHFKGYILTAYYEGENIQIDEFNYISMKLNYKKFATLRYFAFCIRNALRLLMRKEKIDLVATYDPLKTGLIGLLISYLFRAKFACEINGVYTSKYVFIDNPSKFIAWVKSIIYPRIMHFVVKRSDGIKLLFKDQIDTRGYAHDKIVKVFPSYVIVDQFANLENEKEVLFVGFPFKLKGVDILIDAFKRIAHKYPEWKLKILGWYPDPSELLAAIDGHPQIYHHPPVRHSEMPKHIGSCAIFVLPSRTEAMGRSLVEAMAAGKPRIGSNVDGIPAVIEDGVDGLLFESGNSDDLADKLDRLMGDPELRQRLGKAGELRAKKEFSTEAYINNITKFYTEIFDHE